MPTTTASLTVRRILPCPPEAAFRAWTEPARLEKWFAPKPSMKVVAQMDLRKGGKYRIGFVLPGGKKTMFVGGTFLAIKPPGYLEYTWTWEKESNPEWRGRSVVKVEFNGLERGRTEIVLTHERFRDPQECKEHTKGWTKILGRMARALARR
jgi:uncharacterized protein YndB with AHSA1/START domain